MSRRGRGPKICHTEAGPLQALLYMTPLQAPPGSPPTIHAMPPVHQRARVWTARVWCSALLKGRHPRCPRLMHCFFCVSHTFASLGTAATERPACPSRITGRRGRPTSVLSPRARQPSLPARSTYPLLAMPCARASHHLRVTAWLRPRAYGSVGRGPVARHASLPALQLAQAKNCARWLQGAFA